MKKLIVITILLTIITAGAIIGWNYYQSFKPVSFEIKNPAGTVTYALFKAVEEDHELVQSGESIRTITTDETFKLKKGSYVLIPSGEHLDTTPIPLNVSDKTTKRLDVSYSQTYLDQLLATEQGAIKAAINDAYSDTVNRYPPRDGKLYGLGDWYGTTIPINGNTSNPYATGDESLRIILHKENGEWRVITNPPNLTIGSPDYPEIPYEVVKSVNRL